jgi:hypothetical protein
MRHRAKPLVSTPRRRLPCGFDSHRRWTFRGLTLAYVVLEESIDKLLNPAALMCRRQKVTFSCHEDMRLLRNDDIRCRMRLCILARIDPRIFGHKGDRS